MAGPINVNIDPIQGTHTPLVGVVKDKHGQPVDLTGARVRFITKKTRRAPDSKAILVLDSENPTQRDRFPKPPDDTGRWWAVLLPADVDKHMPSVSYFFKVEITLANGEKRVPTIGKLRVEPV